VYFLGISCRYKVIKWLKNRFDNPKAAGVFYCLSRANSIGIQTDLSESTQMLTCEAGTQTAQTNESPEMNELSHLLCQTVIQTALAQTVQPTKINELSHLFSEWCQDTFQLNIPPDFLILAANAMSHLKSNNRSNVIYNLAKGLSTLRADQSDSYFPVTRMPMGLIEYTTNFFVSEHINEVCIQKEL